jgi:[ribosomal protein S5]-alanine N-acetyltransferase
MLDRAQQHDAVRRVVASVSPDNEPSLNLIDQFGFARIGEQWHDEDGLEWVLEVWTAQPGH